jgi:hypothetical protein
MARKRMIDPEFWTDEKLGSCNRNERLFFMGLISNADDEGFGRANVKLLKSTIFPYDDDLKVKDIEGVLITLITKKLVFVYVIDGQEFYYLPNFLKHQVINKPTPSKLPKCPEKAEEIQLPHYYGSDTTPLPPNRIEVKRKEEKGIEGNIPYPQIMELFNATCKSFSKIQAMTDGRKEKVKIRWLELKTLDAFKELFIKAEATPFLKGDNDRKWKATFDWLMENDRNYLKVLEGAYDKQQYDSTKDW